MMKQLVVVIAGAMFLGACSDGSVTGASPVQPSAVVSSVGQGRIGFSVNAIVSGFATGKVFVSGGGSFDLGSREANSGGGFRCVESVLQGPLSVSVNPNDPGPCMAGDGIRWDTASLLDSTGFKCTGAQAEPLKMAVTSDHVVVLQADFYRAGNGNDESFTAKMIVSDQDIAPDFPGANVWVQSVGCGVARSVNFSK
jgi:hypothetical protein